MSTPNDLTAARAACTFPIELLSTLLHGDAATLKRKREIACIIQSDPVFSNKLRYAADRVEQYEASAAAAVKFHQLTHRSPPLSEDEYRLYMRANGVTLCTSLHDVVFLPCLKGQASDEQLQKWLPLAEAKIMCGAYAQTELAHGSNIQGLQTTFTYDLARDEFVVQTPHVSATKYWPGSLGHTANTVVAFGRLLVNGTDHGIHPFLVPIRSSEDHAPLPGITVGDIGSKAGTPTSDNGYLSFNQVRIPRTNMLMRYAKLDKEGKYSKVGGDQAKVVYATMVHVRAAIVQMCFLFLSKSTTIAIRYSQQRRQFGSDANGLELPVLSYSSQQYRLFPQLATAYAIYFTGRAMRELYVNTTGQMRTGNFSGLQLLHITSAGLKSFTTRLTREGIDVCRQCCGGMGYHRYSGLPDLFADFIGPFEAAEGDNWLLTQQVGRYLLKQVAKQMKKGSCDVPYLAVGKRIVNERCTVSSVEQWCDPAVQMSAHRHRTARLCFYTAQLMQQALSTGKPFEQAWNSILVEIANMAWAHCCNSMVAYFTEAVSQLSEEYASLRPVLSQLSSLFALYQIQVNLADFLLDGYVSAEQAELLRTAIHELFNLLAVNAIGLTDAFDYSDYDLNSALAQYEGKPYETLLEWAHKLEPLNRQQVSSGYTKHLHKLYRAKL